MVIKSSTACDSKATKTKIEESINPVELEIGITELRISKYGKVIVRCRDNADAEKLKKDLTQTMSRDYQTLY